MFWTILYSNVSIGELQNEVENAHRDRHNLLNILNPLSCSEACLTCIGH